MSMCSVSLAQQVADLSGDWEFEVDRRDIGKSEHWKRSISATTFSCLVQCQSS